MAWTLPGRADHVGSLLRPARLKSARADFEYGRIDAEALRQIEDQCIRQVVARQEAIGLQAVTDGEFRRAWWHFDYLAGLAGVELAESEHGIQFHGVQTKSQKIVVTGRVDFEQHYMLEHFRFLREVAGATAKMTIPSPSVLHFRGGRASISQDVYPDLDEFFRMRRRRIAKRCRRFMLRGAAICNSTTRCGPICAPKKNDRPHGDRGDDPAPLPRRYADVINHALQDKPADMVVTTHVCRGNFRSSWITEGGYEPVARSCWEKPRTTVISWNTIPNGPADSNRCASCPRAINGSFWGW